MNTFDDYSLDDLRKAIQRWSEIVKEMDRPQLIQLMTDYRGLGEPAYEAANAELLKREQVLSKKKLRDEELEAWATMSSKDIKRKAKKSGKSTQFVRKCMILQGKVKPHQHQKSLPTKGSATRSKTQEKQTYE